jgi:hypothetical protein
MNDAQKVLRALQAVAGPVAAALPSDRDLVVALAMDGRMILRAFELVEEDCGVTFLPAQVIDWAIGAGSMDALLALVMRQRLAAASEPPMGGAPHAPPGFFGPPGSMGRVR